MMSVVSERSYGGGHSRRKYMRMYRPSGGSSNRTVIGGIGVDQQHLILPRFSVASSEGTPRLDLENWADNTTIITGNTSENSYSGAPDRIQFHPLTQSFSKTATRKCSRFCWLFSAFVISFLSLVSAPLMVSIPYLINHFGPSNHHWLISTCEVDCQGYLLNMSGKTVLLVLTFCMLYWRKSPADLPRLFLHRAAFAFFIFFVLFSFWLFYIFRIVLEQNPNYVYIVSYSSSLVDVLLFIHCIWIFSELRHFRPSYSVTIVRDPDGESNSYEIGQMSIQEAAICVLRFYHTHFPIYNPFFDDVRESMLNGGGGRFHNTRLTDNAAGFKLYDIDGRGENTKLSEASARILMEAASRRKMAGHNDLFYEELEWEKRFKKRKCRLVSCAEETFTQVQNANSIGSNFRVEGMETSVTAKMILAGVQKPLNRFLKFMRLQPFYPAKDTSGHLQRCLSYGFSPRTFLERFFSKRRPIEETLSESKWSILSEELASSSIGNGTYFVLRSHNTNNVDKGVQLYCTFSEYPFFNITEQSVPRKTKFALKIANQNSN